VEWRNEQARIRKEIETHRVASQVYLDEGIKLLELAQRAHELFENQPPKEKRKLLDFVLSNCTWKAGELTAYYRQPFDILAAAVASERAVTAQAGASRPESGNWLPRNMVFQLSLSRFLNISGDRHGFELIDRIEPSRSLSET